VRPPPKFNRKGDILEIEAGDAKDDKSPDPELGASGPEIEQSPAAR
jgi:hypothetical protein